MSPPHGDHAQHRIVRWCPSSSTARHLHPPAPSTPCGPHSRIVLSSESETMSSWRGWKSAHETLFKWPRSVST